MFVVKNYVLEFNDCVCKFDKNKNKKKVFTKLYSDLENKEKLYVDDDNKINTT